MSSRSRSVADIIAKCTAVVMKWRGGTRPVSIRPSQLVPYGSKLTHSWQFRTKRASTRAWLLDSSTGAIGDRPGLIGRPINEVRMMKRSQLRKRLALNDFVQADRSHRSNYRKKATSAPGLTAETVIGALEDAE